MFTYRGRGSAVHPQGQLTPRLRQSRLKDAGRLGCGRWVRQFRTEPLLGRYRGEMRRDKRVDSVTEVPWPASEQLMRRQRRYFLLMGVCLTLIVLAWTWVRLWSVPLAVGMSAVAAVIPPIAAFVGSDGVRGG
jgi:hypothetical protein